MRGNLADIILYKRAQAVDELTVVERQIVAELRSLNRLFDEASCCGRVVAARQRTCDRGGEWSDLSPTLKARYLPTNRLESGPGWLISYDN